MWTLKSVSCGLHLAYSAIKLLIGGVNIFFTFLTLILRKLRTEYLNQSRSKDFLGKAR